MKHSTSYKMNTKQDQNQDQDLDFPPPPPPPPPPQRRPRGFAAAAPTSPPPPTAVPSAGGRREREREKERTKLRERHRRAITSRMLAGLRQHGNFPLPARADMNDVLAALAREAGWIVEPDGATYRPAGAGLTAATVAVPPPPPCSNQLGVFPVRSMESPVSSVRVSLDSHSSFPSMDESVSPASLDSVVVAGGNLKRAKFDQNTPRDSPNCAQDDQLPCESDFSGTPYIPVYATLSAGIINGYCQLIDPRVVRRELGQIKSLNADGVTVHCWWGIVEGWGPQKYDWSGYRDLFSLIKEFNLKVQVVLAFHEYLGGGPGEISISLPKWLLEIGRENRDIFFTDREGRRNTQCISWGVDRVRALNGRTGIEVCFDLMRSFRTEFDALFGEGLISAVEIGLGANGELRYPSCPERMGWRYPGIGEFQCYDRYMQQSLRQAATLRGHTIWARGPDNAGYYNSQPNETQFFCDKGDYNTYYGRFFLNWYSQFLIDHADQVLSLASLVFEGTPIVVKIPLVHWWYRTASHAAELMAGYYNPANRDGYAPVFQILKKHSVTAKFVLFCGPHYPLSDSDDDALSDLDSLTWQVMSTAWEHGLTVAAESSLPCEDREMYGRIIDAAKPRDDPDRRFLSFFTYQQRDRNSGFSDLDSFIRCLHGESTDDTQT